MPPEDEEEGGTDDKEAISVPTGVQTREFWAFDDSSTQRTQPLPPSIYAISSTVTKIQFGVQTRANTLFEFFWLLHDIVIAQFQRSPL